MSWLTPDETEMEGEHWGDARAKCFGMLLDGRAQPTGIKRRGQDATLLIVFNAHHDLVEFKLPEAPGGSRWVGLIDTNDPDCIDPPSFDFGHAYEVTGRSLLLFVLASKESQPRPIREGVSAILSIADTPVGEEML